MGDQTFLGPGKTIDTSKKLTIVTQFIGNPLNEIKRFYVQNGKVVPNSQSTISGVQGNSVRNSHSGNIPDFEADECYYLSQITDSWCSAQKTTFKDENSFKTKGGLAQMGKALQQGMVLALSIWDDYTANMLWLDSEYPLDRAASQPGVVRGPCSRDSGKPADVEGNGGDVQVTYSNIKWGELNSTFTAR
jgi:cellulose 1,4-beta-cellobiosidase